MDTLKQVYILRMRKACAEMDHANLCAARDQSRGGWQCDWNAALREAAQEFNEAQASLMSIPDWQHST